MCVISFLYSDINECEVFPNICQGGGLCVNVEGSYRCNCPPGLTLDSTGTKCFGEIIFSLEKQLYKSFSDFKMYSVISFHMKMLQKCVIS